MPTGTDVLGNLKSMPGNLKICAGIFSIYPKLGLHVRSSPNFCMLPMSVVRSSLVALKYTLRTSNFMDDVNFAHIGQEPQNKRSIMTQQLEWWGAGMVICLERDADVHMAQLIDR